ncbi:MAG: amino acid racemase [Negativicutes bacterium]|nr:amino acid racemase [Negativicutes bacterium]
MSKKVGILGGMGPLATVDLFAKIVQNTPATLDQDHLRIIIDNNPQIPPRVEAILEGAESPLPAMAESARLLEKAGADFIVMPCNTAHYWIEELRAAVSVPVYSMIENAAAFAAEKFGRLSGRILLLATGATVSLNLYQEAFAAKSLALQLPNLAEQEMLDKAVRRIKAGEVADNPYLADLNDMLAGYAAGGTEVLLAGCTEVPLFFPYLSDGLARLDATLLLAQMVVARAKGE